MAITSSTLGPGGFPERLKTLRALRRMKQLALATRLGVHVITVSRWERGVARPTLPQEMGLCEVLGVSREELGVTLSPSAARGVSLVSTPAAAAADQEDNVIRREFLQGACGLLGATAFSDWDRLTALLDSRRIDARLLDDLLTVTRNYARQWGEVAPTTLLPLVRRQAALLQTLLVTTPESRALAQRLYSVSSETATVAGWLSVLVQNFGDARRYYSLARDLAREARDGSQLAFALGASSSLFSRISSGDDPARACALLEEADILAGARAPAHMRSWLCARLAEEYAVQGEAAASEEALERANAALGSVSSRGEGIFVCCDPPWLAGFAGNCALLLGRPAVAGRILEETRTAELSLTSQRSAVLTDLSVAYAQQGEIEHACELMAEAVDVAAEAGLAELVGRGLRARRDHLGAWTDSPPVQQLDEKLRLAVA